MVNIVKDESDGLKSSKYLGNYNNYVNNYLITTAKKKTTKLDQHHSFHVYICSSFGYHLIY